MNDATDRSFPSSRLVYPDSHVERADMSSGNARTSFLPQPGTDGPNGSMGLRDRRRRESVVFVTAAPGRCDGCGGVMVGQGHYKSYCPSCGVWSGCCD